MHTLEIFRKWSAKAPIVLVLPANEHDTWRKLCKTYAFTHDYLLVEGGSERFFSVKNGLHALPEVEWVGIHDGVRPLVSLETIDRCFTNAQSLGNAVPVIRPPESVRYVEGDISRSLDRNKVTLVQTPQVFRLSEIRKACQQEYTPDFTDDASVMQAAGYPIYTVEGNRENLKITSPLDLRIAEALL